MTPEEHKAIAIGLVQRPYKHEAVKVTDEVLKMSSEEFQALLRSKEQKENR